MPLLLGSMPEIKIRIAGNPERVWSTIGLPHGDPLTPSVEAIMRDAAHGLEYELIPSTSTLSFANSETTYFHQALNL